MSRAKRCRVQLYVSDDYYRHAGLDAVCELEAGHVGPHQAEVRATCTSYKALSEDEGYVYNRGRVTPAYLRWEG